MANELQWVVGAGLPDLLSEDCELGQNGWITVAGSPNYAFTPPIMGTKSFGFGAGGVEARKSFTGNTEVFGFFALQTALPAAQISLLTLYNSGTTSSQYQIRVNGMGTPPFNVLTGFDSQTSHQASGTVSLTTGIWYVWYHFKTGNGNAILTCGYSQTLVEPTSDNGTTNGFFSVASAVSTLSVSSIDFSGVANTTVIDHIGVATFDMPTGW